MSARETALQALIACRKNGAWSNGAKGEPMTGFPKDGPQPGEVINDFTHAIDAKPDSPNQRRWAASRAWPVASTPGVP